MWCFPFGLDTDWTMCNSCYTTLRMREIQKAHHTPVRQLRKGHFGDPEQLLGLNSKS